MIIISFKIIIIQDNNLTWFMMVMKNYCGYMRAYFIYSFKKGLMKKKLYHLPKTKLLI